MAAGIRPRNCPSRASATMARRCTSSLVPWPTSSSSLGNSSTGRLSMQKKPRSSSARVAVDLPDPDMPVMTTIRCVSGAGACSLLDFVTDAPGERGLGDLLRQLFLEIARRVMALQLEQVVARGHLDDGG